MGLLLDTHVVLWWFADDPSLPESIVAKIRGEPTVCVSAASAWEIAIKRVAGKLDAPEGLTQAVEASGFTPLPITLAHAEAADALPRHHDDPFDRMLVAQARSERLALVTADARLRAYDVKLVPAS